MDRNISREISLIRPYASLSARRAWIEIWAWGRRGTASGVALRKESVDRNVFGFGAKLVHSGRSPQGERG